MNGTSDTRILSFIEDNIDRLRKSEVKVASYIPGNAEKIIHFSLNELAEAAGVSEPTVIRFCRALGFSGWQEFKIYLAQTIIPQLQNIHESVSEGDQAQELIGKVCQTNVDAIQQTAKVLDSVAVERAITVLATSRRVIFHGLGGSAVVAMDAYHKFFRTGLLCEWFNDAHMAAMAASLLTAEDAFLAISHSGATRDILEAVDAAKKGGARTIAIVSHRKSPVSKIADITIQVAATEVNYRFEPMSSRIAQLCIIDILAVGVGLERKDELYANLSKARRTISNKRL